MIGISGQRSNPSNAVIVKISIAGGAFSVGCGAAPCPYCRYERFLSTLHPSFIGLQPNRSIVAPLYALLYTCEDGVRHGTGGSQGFIVS